MVGKAILFDLDDTLYDFGQTWERVSRRFLRDWLAMGTTPLETAWPIFERINQRLYRYVDRGQMHSAIARRLRWQLIADVLASPTPSLDIDCWVQSHVAAMATECIPFPDTVSTLTQLAPRASLAIVTNGPQDLLDLRVQTLQLSHLIAVHHRFSAEAVGSFKPHPQIFQHALAGLGVGAEEAVMVGDSWHFDILGAAAAGIPAIWVNRSHQPCPDRHKIVAEITELKELLCCLPWPLHDESP